VLRQLRIRHFKCWEDTGTVNLAPITLLFGANSSGKSSIGQFLMMLKQTIESPDRRAVFYPGGRNSAVQLGSYRDMVFRHDPKRRIQFEYVWDLEDPMRIRDQVSEKTYKGNSLSFAAEAGLKQEEGHEVAVHMFEYRLLEKERQLLRIGMARRAESKSEYSVEANGYSLVRQRGRAWSPRAPVRFYGFPEEVVAYHQNADFVQDFNLQHERLFRSVHYLGPLRTRAERLYSWTGIEPESVGYAGENTVAALLAAKSRRISLGYRRPSALFQEVIASKLKQMRLIDEFEVRAISERREEYEVKVRTRGSSSLVDLPDVGFGVAQVLPVLVQSFYLPHNSIIIMEQPEIHLHPSAQSDLADVIIDAVNSREEGRDRSIQLIIETHSEDFLRRLLRRIAEDRIKREQVSAYFANVSGDVLSLEPLRIDIFGHVLNWPDGFFGDEFGDITAQARAALSRRSAAQTEAKGDVR